MKFLICIHHFEAPSVLLLHQFISEQNYGRLYAATEIEADSSEAVQRLCSKVREDTFMKYGLAYPKKIADAADYSIYRYSPFLKRQKASFEEYDRYVYRGFDEYDPFVKVEDGWEFQEAEISVLTPDQAVSQWGDIEVADGRRRYETWKTSDDAKNSSPENHECYFLRECEAIAPYLSKSSAKPEGDTQEILLLEAEDVPTIDREAVMKDTADRILIYARAVELIVETFRETAKNIKYAALIRQLIAEGWFPTYDALETDQEKEKAFNSIYKDFNRKDDIRKLKELIGECPVERTGDQYDEWCEKFDQHAKLYFERLVHGDREGMTYEDCRKEYNKKKESLAKN